MAGENDQRSDMPKSSSRSNLKIVGKPVSSPVSDDEHC